MIFYFSGTGNSLHAAKALAGEGEALYDMAKCCRDKTWDFCPGEEESVGFVFPVYYGGLPSVVRHFVRKVRFAEAPFYLWSVITCGADTFAAGDMLRSQLGAEVDAVFSLKMPDNYVVLYELSPEEKQQEVLAQAEIRLAEIREAISRREIPTDRTSAKAKAMTSLMYPLYANGRGTKKFWVDDSCVGCGACAARCPVGAIQMSDGHPVWVKDRCAHCMSCIRCGAIQYGKRTQGRVRWKHPDLRKKAHCEETPAE